MKDDLWTSLPEDSIYKKDEALFQEHLLEQYKMYVEMADRISQRRNLANVFFLTLNTSIVTGFGFVVQEEAMVLSGMLLWILFSGRADRLPGLVVAVAVVSQLKLGPSFK